MELIAKLAESGTLGVLLAISVGLNYYLIRLLLAAYQASIVDAKAYNEKLAGQILKFSNTIEKLEKKVVVAKKPKGE